MPVQCQVGCRFFTSGKKIGFFSCFLSDKTTNPKSTNPESVIFFVKMSLFLYKEVEIESYIFPTGPTGPMDFIF